MQIKNKTLAKKKEREMKTGEKRTQREDTDARKEAEKGGKANSEKKCWRKKRRKRGKLRIKNKPSSQKKKKR